MNCFGGNLNAALKNCGMKKSQFALRLDVTEGAVHNYCNGRSYPKYGGLCEMCNILSVSPNVLLSGEYNEADTELPHIQAVSDAIAVSPDLAILVDSMMSCANNQLFSTLGERICVLRYEAGYPVAAMFAKRCGVASSTLSGIERGKSVPGLHLLVEFCRALRVSPEYLMYDDLRSSLHTLGRYGDSTPVQIAMIARAVQFFEKPTRP